MCLQVKDCQSPQQQGEGCGADSPSSPQKEPAQPTPRSQMSPEVWGQGCHCLQPRELIHQLSTRAGGARVSPSSLLPGPAGGAASIRGRAGPQGGQKGDEGTCMLATVLCSHFISQSKCPDHVCIKWAGCALRRRENQTGGSSASDHHALGSDRPWAQRENLLPGLGSQGGFHET